MAQAEALLQGGDVRRAERVCRTAVRQAPRNADAWHLHALIALRAGNLAKARTRLERAVALRGGDALFHSNLGAVRERLGDLDGAVRAFDRALALDPDPADTWFNHGLVLLRLGRPLEAAASLRAARARSGRDAEVRLNLARALERSGEPREALGEYRAALGLAAGAGSAGADGARWAEEARTALQRLLAAVFPAEVDPEVRRIVVEAGVPPELGPAAAAQLRADLCAPPAAASGVAAGMRGDGPENEAPPDDAAGAPDDAAVTRFLADGARDDLLLGYLRGVINGDPHLERLFVRARARLLRAWCDAAAHSSDAAGCADGVNPADGAGPAASGDAQDAAPAASGVPGKHGAPSGGRAAAPDVDLTAALALQCFHNEYVWFEDEEEERLLAEAAARLERALAAEPPAVPGLPAAAAAGLAPLVADLLAVALYRPAHGLAGADRLASVPAEGWPAPVAELLRHTLHAPREERALALDLPALSPIRDAVSRTVQAQYEDNPYPRWLSLPSPSSAPAASSGTGAGAEDGGGAETGGGGETGSGDGSVAGTEVGVGSGTGSGVEAGGGAVAGAGSGAGAGAEAGAEIGAVLARRFPHRAAAAAPAVPARSVLAAGGGTGFEPLLVARDSPRARVVSLDLSRASLAYGARMARRLGIGNVRFVQGDLLDAEALGERFDVVLASGVLHHMADPVAGMRALVRVLAPGGLMKLGLYSESARGLVSAAREAAGRAGRDGSPDGIRRFRRDVLAGRRPELAGLLESADFYTVSACRDLVFHVHERRYTLPDLARALAACGLRPLGFDAGADVRRRYRQRFPDDPSMRSLERCAEFEADHPETFAGMYVLWVERDEPLAAPASASG